MRDDQFFKDTPRTTFNMAGKPIYFPILYYDSRMISGTFTVKTKRLKKLLPHPNFKPVEILPGVSVFTIAALEYRDTSIEPYNEIAICTPVKFPPKFIFPWLSAISMRIEKNFSVYIHHLPVTTEMARKVGIHFFNYPKFLAEITFKDHDDKIEVTLRENGELILKMHVEKLPLNQTAQTEFHTYSIKENVVMHTLIEGWSPRYRLKMVGSKAELELGSHWISQEIAGLNLSNTSLAVLHTDGMMTKLYTPNLRWDVNTLAVVPD